MPEHQARWYDIVDKYNYTGIISPRDHGKTTSVPRVITEHDTLFTTNDNTLLLNKTYKQANKTLKVIEKDLTKNDLIQQDFEKELEDFYSVGNQLFYNQTNDVVRRDATVEANGLLGDITGAHFNRIIPDDLVDDENTRTSASRENTINWLNGTVMPLLEEDGRAVIIGTIKHFNDLYKWLQDNPTWFVLVEKAIIKMPKNYDKVYTIDELTGKKVLTGIKNIKGSYKVLWPNKWPIEKLLLKKENMGSIFFNREYQSDPTGLQGQLLKTKWLQYYRTPEMKDAPEDVRLLTLEEIKALIKFQGWDLAITENEIADSTVCTTIGTDRISDMFVLDWFKDHIEFPTQLKEVMLQYDKWEPNLIGIEKVAYQKALPQQVLATQNLPIKAVPADNEKTRRILSAFVVFENKKIWLPWEHHHLEDFRREYLQFNKGDHEDMLDSGAHTINLIQKSRRATVFAGRG